jgi:ribokinase
MKILNFGSLNIDYVYHVNHFNRQGETQQSKCLEVFCGGKGLNQSIALSRSGIEVYHAGAVGIKDSLMLLEMLVEAGVNVDYIKKIDEESGHAIIQKDNNGQNSILLYGGANEKIEKEDVEEVLSHFNKGDFIILQNEISCLQEIMETAHSIGMKIVLNPSPMNSDILKYPIQYVDYIILNEIEAEEICDEEGEPEVLLQKIVHRFPNVHVILTLGEKGVLYKYRDTTFKHDIYNVDVVDTTAAGDTFTGYFIGSIIKEKSVEEALELATIASAISVTRPGAAPSIPKLEEVLNWKN